MSPTITRKPSFTSPSPSQSPSSPHTHTLPPRSRTSSTTSLTSIKHPLNPHPYAIKTTSSAVTSSSSPAHAQAYKHYVPPPSPSPTGEAPRSRTGSFTGSAGGYNASGFDSSGGGVQGGQGHGHRYSRSMTDAGPRALPIPPSMDRSASASPAKLGFVEMEADAGYFGDVGSGSRGTMKTMASLSSTRTPRQSGVPGVRRADTLPSEHSNSPFVFPVPHPSRTRAESISSDEDDHDDDDGDFASNSRFLHQQHDPTSQSPNTSSRFAPVRRSNGSRVRGMVASFERSASSSSGSELDDDYIHHGSRSRSTSPTKPKSSLYNSNSPIKAGGRGALPNRRSVADLFSSASPAHSSSNPSPYTLIPTTTSPEHTYAYGGEADDLTHTTVKPTLTTRRTSKELPRLLPYPPPLAQTFFPASPPVGNHAAALVPAHTGAAFPLPMSPDHTGGVGVGVGIGDLGYLVPVPNQGTGGRTSARLLPIPPDLVPSPPREEGREPEQTLHHPRPVRGGPPELVQMHDQGEGEEEEPSIEELLAREEAQASPNGTTKDEFGARARGKGVSAWEMSDVGDTVKRVPGGPRPLSSNHTGGRVKKRGSGEAGLGLNGKRASPLGTGSEPTHHIDEGGLVDTAGAEDAKPDQESPTIAFADLNNAGFVNRRSGRRARVRPKGSRSSLDSVGSAGSIGGGGRVYEETGSQTEDGVLSLLGAAVSEPAASKELESRTKAVEQKEVELDEKRRKLDNREKELSEVSLEIEETQRELSSLQTSLLSRAAEVDARAEAVGLREEVCVEREKSLLERVRGLDERERATGDMEEWVKEGGREVEGKVGEVEGREAEVKRRERELEVRAENLKMSLEERAREVEGREVEVAKREDELEAREEAVKAKELELEAREAGVKEKEADIASRESVLKAKETLFASRERQLSDKESLLSTKESSLNDKEASVKAREEALSHQETSLNLAARLFQRVCGRVLGERVGAYVGRPLGVSPAEHTSANSASSSSTSPSTSTSTSEAQEASADKGKAKAKVQPQRANGTLGIWAAWAPLLKRSPYFVVLGLGVCAVVLRVLVKNIGRGGSLGGGIGGVGNVVGGGRR